MAKRSDPVPETKEAATAAKTPAMLLPLVAFVSGAAVMIIELSGARLVAPVYGNTLYTWTAIIGVVLVALSIGGYLGGWLADRKAGPLPLATFLIAAGLFCFAVPALALAVGAGAGGAGSSLVAGPLWMSAVLFIVPAVLLGAVGPYSVKWLSVIRPDHAVGRSAGLISMMGSLGSFVGTFATGFYLLANFDLRTILAASGAGLVLIGLVVLLLGRAAKPVVVGILLVAMASGAWLAKATPVALGDGVVFAKNTYYHLIRVVEHEVGGTPVRSLLLDSTTEGSVALDGGALPLPYQNYWQILGNDSAFTPQRSLFIGAGAFGMPKAVAARWPDSVVEVVEIDPEVIAVGERFFGSAEAPNLEAHAADGRVFLRGRPAGGYDFIFGDAYNGVSYIPPHLVTSEFFGIVADKLKPDGVYMMNLISAVHGPDAELAAGVVAGLAEHFPHLAAFAVHGRSPSTRQNVIVMASRQPLDRFLDTQGGAARVSAQLRRLLDTRLPESRLDALRGNGVVFTDMRNPIDRIIATQIRRAATETWSPY